MNESFRIALVEDEPLVRASLERLLAGHALSCFPDARALLRHLEESRGTSRFDLVLSDLCNAEDPDGSHALAALPSIRALLPRAELYVVSGVNEVETMRASVRAGAARFVLKDAVAQELPSLLARFGEMRTLRRALDAELRGNSPVMDALKRELLALRFERMDVLVEGETGSGKEMCARALHAGGPWVAVNVSAVPAELFEAEFFGAEKGAYTGASQARAGYLEAAGGGTLFLDEIQSLPLAQQAKLLRAFESRSFTRVGSSQERPFRARVVAAANVELKDAVAKGRFREDLFYRIAQVTVRVPPLRVRGRDVTMLAESFLKETRKNESVEFLSDALEFLASGYDWPGNVRELRNLVRGLAARATIPKLGAPEVRAALAGTAAEPTVSTGAGSETPFQPDFSLGLDENVERFERYFMGRVVSAAPNSQEARERLKLARSRFYEKLKAHGLAK